MPGPLDGFRVLDFSAVISGPLAAMVLADQGADVVKIEAPDRPDLLRLETDRRARMSSLFANVNRGKRSIAVDLKDGRGRSIVHELARRADVVVENYRPGVAEALGVGYETLRELQSEIVYCSIRGYGETGPFAKQRAYDPVVQGITGYVGVQQNPEVPIPDLARNTVVDKATSHMAAQAITAALLARERGQGGQHIQLSMVDAGLAFLWPDGMQRHTLLGDDIKTGPTLYERYALTETKDGRIVVWTGADREWLGLFRALGLPELCEDERFATGAARMRHVDELSPLIHRAFARFTSAELLERMRAEDVPAGPANDLDEVFDHPQVVHNSIVYHDEHPQYGALRQCSPAPRFLATSLEKRPPAPLLGEHTDELLAELGHDEASVAALRGDRIVA